MNVTVRWTVARDGLTERILNFIESLILCQKIPDRSGRGFFKLPSVIQAVILVDGLFAKNCVFVDQNRMVETLLIIFKDKGLIFRIAPEVIIFIRICLQIIEFADGIIMVDNHLIPTIEIHGCIDLVGHQHGIVVLAVNRIFVVGWIILAG